MGVRADTKYSGSEVTAEFIKAVTMKTTGKLKEKNNQTHNLHFFFSDMFSALTLHILFIRHCKTDTTIEEAK